jgi:hypothetical protein
LGVDGGVRFVQLATNVNKKIFKVNGILERVGILFTFTINSPCQIKKFNYTWPQLLLWLNILIVY